MKEKSNSEIRRLVLAKKLYLHGCSHASNKDKVSRMLAIHHFDNAVEIILKCVATKQGLNPERKYFHFEELLKKIKDLPLKEQIRSLHQIRNIVQHQGDIPPIDTIVKYKGYVEDFFREICSEIFSVPYGELYLSALIENEKLRKQVLEAEMAFEKGKFKQCIKLCGDTLISTTFEESDIFHTAGMLIGLWGASEELKKIISENYLEKYKEKDFYEPVRELSRAILQLGQATSTMQFLGGYKIDFLKYWQIIQNLEDLSKKELKEGAEFSLNFVTDLILKWQEEGILKEEKK